MRDTPTACKGRRKEREEGVCGYKKKKKNPCSDETVFILSAVLVTQIYTCHNIAQNSYGLNCVSPCPAKRYPNILVLDILIPSTSDYEVI